jgi:hypothetical protein
MQKNLSLFFLFSCIVLSLSCTSQKQISTTNNENDPIAFPGAEGYGKYATGGRGGKTFIVSNLNDKGPAVFVKQQKQKEKK